MSGSDPVYVRAKRKYEQGGFSNLIRSIPTFTQRNVNMLPYFIIKKDILDRDGLKRECNRFWEFTDSEEAKITKPDTFHELPEAFESFVTEYDVGPSFVCELDHALLVGDHGVAFHDNKLVLESCYNERHMLKVVVHDMPYRDKLKLLNPSLSCPIKRGEEVVFPLVLGFNSFFDWIVNYLPKLWALETYIQEIGISPKILIQSNPPRWMVESLELLNVDMSRVIEATDATLEVEKLVLGTHRHHNVSNNFNPHFHEYNWLRTKAVEHTTSGNSSRIYISREDANYRRIKNESEVLEILERRGFEKVELANLRFAEQVRILSNADIIIGVHGAGLTNMIWSKDPTVIELVPDEFQKPTFFCLSEILGYGYDFMLVDTVSPNKHPGYRDVVVDTNDLQTILDRHSID